MIKLDVLNRFSGKVQFTAEIDCAETEKTSVKLGLAIKWAIKTKAKLGEAYLDGANLDGAYLAGAYLDGANLAGANLAGANLIGERPIIQIGGIGSRNSCLTGYLTEKGIRIKTGCWFGTIEEFEKRVAEKHSDNEHSKEYAAAITYIKTHAKIWGETK